MIAGVFTTTCTATPEPETEPEPEPEPTTTTTTMTTATTTTTMCTTTPKPETEPEPELQLQWWQQHQWQLHQQCEQLLLSQKFNPATCDTATITAWSNVNFNIYDIYIF